MTHFCRFYCASLISDIASCFFASITHNTMRECCINSLRPRPNRRHFADDIFKCIFLNENAWISLKISLKFVPKVRINNIPALVQMMAWRRPGDKPLSEPMVVSLLTHICVARPQWVKITIRVYGWCQAISSKPKYQMRVFPLCFPDVSFFGR